MVNTKPKLHTATMQIRLRPEAKAAFLAAAKARGVSLSVLVVLATWREVRGEREEEWQCPSKD